MWRRGCCPSSQLSEMVAAADRLRDALSESKTRPMLGGGTLVEQSVRTCQVKGDQDACALPHLSVQSGELRTTAHDAPAIDQ